MAGLPRRSFGVGGCSIVAVQGFPKPLAGVRFPPPVLGLFCANRPAHLRDLKSTEKA